MSQQNNAAFLSKAKSLFAIKNAVTDTLRDTEQRIDAAIKKVTPAKRPLRGALGFVIGMGALLPTPAAPLFWLTKGVLLVGGFAVMTKSLSNAAPSSVRFDSARQGEALSYDTQNERDIAALQARLQFQPSAMQEKFKDGFNMATEKRAALIKAAHPETHIAKWTHATATI